MSAKIIVSVVSLVLVVGVAIGVVIAVNNKEEDPYIQSSQKYVGAICQNTNEQNLCHQTLKSVQGRDSADPKAYVVAAVKATTDSVIKALNMTDRLTIEHGSNDDSVKMALSNCKELLHFAMSSLKLSTDMVQNNNIQQVHNQDADFKNWLSAVISYKQSCTDGFDDKIDGEKKIKEQLQTQSIDHVTKVTGMTLDIVTGLSHILQQFGLKVNLKAASRRLLAEDGNPTWVSAADRKLLDVTDKEKWRNNLTPNVVVAKDGSGQFKTVLDAINSYPKGHQGRYAVYVKAGVYDEYIIVPEEAENLFIYGDGPGKTIITGHRNYADHRLETTYTATFSNLAKRFFARALTFENTAGPNGLQAVAFRNIGDMSAIIDCELLGYQDTLWAQANRQFYRNCVIAGTIDFIFGASAVVVQNSKIIVRKPNDNQYNAITADGTELYNMTTGIVIQGCDIVSDQALEVTKFRIRTYLGRPWKNLSRAVVMESNIGDFVHPQGWYIWEGKDYEQTCRYAEYNNAGPGANVSGRIKWRYYRPALSRDEASKFTVANFLKAGNSSESGDVWLQALRAPNFPGLIKP